MKLTTKDFKAGDVVKLSKYGVDQFTDFNQQKYLTEPWIVERGEDRYVKVRIPNYFGSSGGYPFFPKELELVKTKPSNPIKWI